MKKRLSKTLENTKFSGAPIIAVAAKPDQAAEALGITELVDLLSAQAYETMQDLFYLRSTTAFQSADKARL